MWIVVLFEDDSTLTGVPAFGIEIASVQGQTATLVKTEKSNIIIL